MTKVFRMLNSIYMSTVLYIQVQTFRGFWRAFFFLRCNFSETRFHKKSSVSAIRINNRRRIFERSTLKFGLATARMAWNIKYLFTKSGPRVCPRSLVGRMLAPLQSWLAGTVNPGFCINFWWRRNSWVTRFGAHLAAALAPGVHAVAHFHFASNISSSRVHRHQRSNWPA